MKISLASIGCRTNQEEIVTLRGELGHAGFTVVEAHEDADVIIVNTCSVTFRTEAKTRRFLHSLARKYPKVKILVTGCMAQQKGESLLAIDNVSWVVGNARKHDIPTILREKIGGVFCGKLVRSPLIVPEQIEPPSSGYRTRLHLKIQEGCCQACAYCIVSALRGPSRSASGAAIVDLCKRALDAGYKEIVLTGTHIGQFRDDNGERLLQFVERLLRLDGDFRVRLSSLDPAELTNELLSLAGEGKKLCNHLHLSLQSLSAEVIRKMNRSSESLDAVIKNLAAFRRRYPDAGLGADFIVGFPGETDTMFDETILNVNAIGFSYAHIFRYSVRPGTAAAEVRGQIPEPVKRLRSEQLGAIIRKSRQKFIERQQGTKQRIIVEQQRPVRGITSNYLAIEVPEYYAEPNSWLDVVIDGAADKGKFCRAHPMVNG